MVVKFQDVLPAHHIYIGRLIHSRALKHLEILPKAAIGISANGTIVFLDNAVSDIQEIRSRYSSVGFGNAAATVLSPSQFLFPGLIDTHLHAPQWPNLALGMDGDLRKWVEEWTDPMEASYSDNEKALRVYADVVQTTLALGTTTVAYNSSKHWQATNILADTCLKYGQRAIIGKLSVTTGSTRGNWEDSTEQSLTDTEKVVQHINQIDPEQNIVKYCIQPRGGPFCPAELMKGMGDLAAKYDAHIQAHCCETHDDIDRTLKLHRGFECYTDMYKAYGLLTDKSLLAHCIHLQAKDFANLKATRAAVAHNPNSNTCLRDGECNVRRLLDEEIKVGLGTDCSAGYLPSIMDAMRQASNVSRHLAIRHDNDDLVLDFSELVYLATLGGAQALQMEKVVGNFEPGKKFDALLIDVEGVISADHSLWEGKEDGSEAMVKKWVFLGETSSIKRVFVDGRLAAGVHAKEPEHQFA